MEDGRYFDSIFIKSKKSKTKVKRNIQGKHTNPKNIPAPINEYFTIEC